LGSESLVRKLLNIIAVVLMLLAVGCGGVQFVNAEFNLPDDKEGPEYGAETP
jgi:hypothetical protein